MSEVLLNEEFEDEEFEAPCVEVKLRKKIIDAQLLLERNKENINPVLYTELMFILGKPIIQTLEELEQICEKHR